MILAMKMKGINRIIDNLVSSGRNGDVRLDSDGLLESLAKSEHTPQHWWEIYYQKGLRLVLIISTALITVTAILYYGIRYVNDIILYENHLTINSQGAFNPRKSMNCEYALYLFNTADLWANSGIQINEKDRIKINISGAFNSSVEGTIVAAKENTALTYPWVSYDNDNTISDKNGTISGNSNGISNKKKGLNLCISRNLKNFDFGSLMYAIVPDSKNLRENPLQLGPKPDPTLDSLRNIDTCQKDKKLWNADFELWEKEKNKRFNKSKKTGTLYFAVNDMYFRNNEEMESYYRDPSVHNFYDKPYSEQEISTRRDNQKHDYEDNLGQLLVSVEIQRHVPYAFLHPTMAYRYLEYQVNGVLDRNKHNFIGYIIIIFGCIGYSVVFLLWITALFALYMALFLCTIYLAFFIGHRLHIAAINVFRRFQ